MPLKYFCAHYAKKFLNNKRAYTYIKTKEGRNFKGVPPLKINNFEIGNKKLKIADSYCLTLISKNKTIWTDNCFEAVRLMLTRHLSKITGSENYFLKLLKYPFQINRFHKIASGAKADRISSGMRLSFGEPHSRCARVNAGDKVLVLYFKNLKLKPLFEKSLWHIKYITRFKLKLLS